MSGTKPEASEESETPEVRRLSFDLAIDVWNELQREAAELSIAEGKSVAVSEVARRRVMAGSKVVA